jgi:hypothetical protein
MNKFINKFKKGTQYVNIVKAVTDDELIVPDEVNDDYLNQKCVKFIPASGAATRMFKDLYKYLDYKEDTEFINRFFDNLESLPFYEDVKECIDFKEFNKDTVEGRTEIIDYILHEGLEYGSLPKAVIKIHSYDGFTTTPIEEHIFEGKKYLNKDRVNLHFTISKEHEELFNYVVKVLNGIENTSISYSFQKEKTDTLAVDMDDNPFKLEDGSLLYRAGGHGALIENLNDIDGDIVFIKNIDNVCHRNYIKDTVDSKKALASVGYKYKGIIDSYIDSLISDAYHIDEIGEFISDKLNISYKGKITKEIALRLLNRPLRVCGVVKNQGEPGGGPFVVDNGEYLGLQICEKSEIDLKDEKKLDILNNSEYFNPVDIVCFVKDYKGDKFNLLDYINEDRYFISKKTYRGRELKALEHPGLWNGAMDNWNTLFVEVPLITFNPVKTVNDLLRDGHVGESE